VRFKRQGWQRIASHARSDRLFLRRLQNITFMDSFVSCLMHCVFATKERRALIRPELQARLWPYLGGGFAREKRMKALVVGGVEDRKSRSGIASLPFRIGWRTFLSSLTGLCSLRRHHPPININRWATFFRPPGWGC